MKRIPVVIDAKYLKGLKFQYSKPGPIVAGDQGNQVQTYVSRERDLTPDDVLAVREDVETINFVTADGQKYSVPR